MGLTVAAVRHRQSQKCPHLGRGTGVTPRRKTPKWLRPCPPQLQYRGLGVSGAPPPIGWFRARFIIGGDHNAIFQRCTS